MPSQKCFFQNFLLVWACLHIDGLDLISTPSSLSKVVKLMDKLHLVVHSELFLLVVLVTSFDSHLAHSYKTINRCVLLTVAVLYFWVTGINRHM